jgi:hypothetical protein
LPQWAQRIFNLGRDDGVDGAFYQTVPLQFPQCLDQHFWRRPDDRPLQVAQSFRRPSERENNQDRPLSGYQLQPVPSIALSWPAMLPPGPQEPLFGAIIYSRVSIAPSGAYFPQEKSGVTVWS